MISAADFSAVVLATIITAVGLSALVDQILRWKGPDRALLWFGLFAAMYGLRLYSSITPVQFLLGVSELPFLYFRAFFTYAILIPADAAGDFFGEKRFAPFLLQSKGLPAEECANALLNELRVWSKARPQTDDISFVVLDVN